jgi:hypothetical protein
MKSQDTNKKLEEAKANLRKKFGIGMVELGILDKSLSGKLEQMKLPPQVLHYQSMLDSIRQSLLKGDMTPLIAKGKTLTKDGLMNNKSTEVTKTGLQELIAITTNLKNVLENEQNRDNLVTLLDIELFKKLYLPIPEEEITYTAAISMYETFLNKCEIIHGGIDRNPVNKLLYSGINNIPEETLKTMFPEAPEEEVFYDALDGTEQSKAPEAYTLRTTTDDSMSTSTPEVTHPLAILSAALNTNSENGFCGYLKDKLKIKELKQNKLYEAAKAIATKKKGDGTFEITDDSLQKGVKDGLYEAYLIVINFIRSVLRKEAIVSDRQQVENFVEYLNKQSKEIDQSTPKLPT